jgi:Response regulator containing CheY-like receiver, AAA-type ATPase, and DNA-binding domains
MFSVAVLTEMLTNQGFEVAGSANNLEEAAQAVKTLKPDLVTVDMTMPGADGLEVTKAIHILDPKIKVVIVSSMMDDEIVKKARKVNVSGYLQKPVDAEELALTINRIMADEELFEELKASYYAVFKETLSDTFNKFLKEAPAFEQENHLNHEQVSLGISVVMGITGKYIGRVILDTSDETLTRMTAKLLGREAKTAQEKLNILSEVANIAAGNACSMLNRQNKLFGLRVAPPTVLHGESLVISKSDLDTVVSSAITTAFGELSMNVGFTRGDEKWTTGI